MGLQEYREAKGRVGEDISMCVCSVWLFFCVSEVMRLTFIFGNTLTIDYIYFMLT